MIDELRKVALAILATSATLSSQTTARDDLIRRGLALGLSPTDLSAAGTISRQAIYRKIPKTPSDLDAPEA